MSLLVDEWCELTNMSMKPKSEGQLVAQGVLDETVTD